MKRSSSFKLGTRHSALARWQAEWVAAQLAVLGCAVEMVYIATAGDRAQGAVSELGNQGVFTKEIQRALLDGAVDLAVHSLKDLPTVQPAGLIVAATPPRGPAGDVLVSRFPSFAHLPPEARVGTSSPRRRAQLLSARADLRVVDVRGNVDTRLKKLDALDYEAIVLAEAGLMRLALAARIAQRLPFSLMLPAVGQGALAVETRIDDHNARAAVAPLDDANTHAAIVAERALLARLQGGCLAPVAAHAEPHGSQLRLSARVLSLDGRLRIEDTLAGDAADAEPLGQCVADLLLARGAADLVSSARQNH